MELLSCRDDAERGRLLDLSRRLRPIAMCTIALLLVVALVGAPTFGWLIVLPPLPGMLVLWRVQRNPERRRHPERWLLLCLALTQTGLAASLAIAHEPSIYMLPALMLLALFASVVLPVRMAVLVTAFSVQLMLAVALGFHLGAVRRNPFALLYPLAITIAGAGIAMVVASLDVTTRGVAILDPLMGLPNRIALRARVAELEHQSAVSPQPVAVIVADPDRFKSINDRYGHAVGDAVLHEIAVRMRGALGANASPYRLGGEELVALVVDADLAAGAAAAERVRRAVCARAIEGLRVELSLGVAASAPGEPFSFRELFGDADRALYEAKRAGGNRVRLWPPAGEPAAARERRTAGMRAGPFAWRSRRAPASPQEGASVHHGAEEPADRWASWNAREHAATGNWLVSDDLQRRQLLELNRRLREHAKPAFLIGFAVGGASALQYGWQILVAPALMSVVYVLIEHHAERFRHPEYALGAGWLGLQSSFIVSAALANGPMLFAAPLLLLLLIGSSAVFPPRGVAIGAAFTGAIVVALGVTLYRHLLLSAPAILVVYLVLVAVIALIGAAVGRSTIEYRDLAVVDQLTGLLNRGALTTRVAELGHRTRAGATGVAVVVADVDRFKEINDSHGHPTGDLVLREIGYRVRQNLRAFESAYRIGGEEFVILLDQVNWPDAEGVAARLCDAIASAPLAGVHVTMSVGVAASSPGETFDYERLFKRADAALYRAKRAGGNCVCTDRTGASPAASNGAPVPGAAAGLPQGA